ncbi:sulfite exporter TauE/SafE family protein [Flavobacterium lacisediminis]|uniref:Probable membrane transporter protein n=1 Tax=Flavobacterium lacisediminis TaxID=2989705 RepID=A0ABT3EKX5_9FLAO|nr:sulfite exporter TauE/SafE family protein [Flavobacterium lacisediminis]MCW1149215.1 sulfite exporter TauE/SafE family protein [Flavobacterium lacisediminis]
MEILGYVGALFIGLVLGLTGGGGSILTVPILVYLMSISPVTATAYSLFIVGTTSTFGAIQNYRKNLVDIKNGFIFAIPSFIAVYLTRKFIVPRIPEIIIESPILITKNTFLMLFFAVIMIFGALSVLKKKSQDNNNEEKRNLILIGIQTFTIGIIIGLVGAGGGFLIIPSLILFAKLRMRKAVGTSLFIIAMNSLVGFIGDVQNLVIDWIFLLTFSAISVVGIFLGMYLTKYTNESQLKKIFAYFVLLMAAIILLKEM